MSISLGVKKSWGDYLGILFWMQNLMACTCVHGMSKISKTVVQLT